MKMRQIIGTLLSAILLTAITLAFSSCADEKTVTDDTGAAPKDTTTTETMSSETKVITADETIPDTAFVADLSAFEEYMNPSDRDAFLVLVNKQTHLSENDVPQDLIPVVNARSDRTGSVYMISTAEKALEALFIEAEAEGMTYQNPATGQILSVMSGYRSYATQSSLYNTYVNREKSQHSGWTQEQAEAEASTYSARPGESEHQTGLCCDMHNLSSADQSFAAQEAATWLKDNCWKFGFILRFPSDKEAITGYSFEPWHFRFVGRYHAYQIHKNGMCLEEYLDTLS